MTLHPRVAHCLEAGIAAELATDYELNGYTDWFLPSKEALDFMYINLRAAGVGGFNTVAAYWASTEYNIGAAWSQYFHDGYPDWAAKFLPFSVRAVRAF